MSEAPQSSIVLYQTEDGRTRIQCRFQDETIWLTQALMAELFQIGVNTVNHHLKELYDEGEIEAAATIRQYRIVRTEGTREVTRDLEHYSLPAILAVGYRVRSHRGTQFRQWATARLSEYLVKGFTMDDERLKNPPGKGQTDYFDELLERIRDIRSGASIRRCWTSTRPASTTARTPRRRSGSSPRSRTRCIGPRTATRPRRSFTSVPTRPSR